MQLDGLQNLFVVYFGMGIQKYFTAESREAAARFLLSQKDYTLNEYTSMFLCPVYIKAKGEYWLRDGDIPVAIHLPLYVDGAIVNSNVYR